MKLAELCRWSCACFTTLIILLFLGCSSDGPEPPPPISLYVNASPSVNDGHLVYMMVRSVSEKQFIDESYETVANKAFPVADDPNLLGLHAIIPGEKREIVVSGSAKGVAAVYFLFTDPGINWKTLLSEPLEESYGVELPGYNRAIIGEEPGFFSRVFEY